MKTISDSVKNAFKQPTTKRKGVIVVNGQYYDVYNVEYYADCYDEGKVIGNAIASQLDFDIPYMPKFDTFQYYDCIWTGSGYEYIDYGTFNVFDEKDQDEFNKHITAFDNLIKFNKPFENVTGYPRTLYNELLNVCTQAGVTLANASIPNGSFVVANNQFTDGQSLKTVLKQICAISGTYGIIKNNNLHLQLINQTDEVLDKNQHEPTDWKRRSYGINQVILGDSQIEGEYVIKQDDEDIALNGVHKLEILDNLFAYNQEKRSALIDALYAQVHGFGYIPYETKGEWLSYLEIGDTVNIDGIDTLLLRVNAKSPNALETTMSAPAIIDSSIEYVDNTDDVNNRLKRTEISVDKQNQTIEGVVSQVDDQNEQIAIIRLQYNELISRISDIADITTSGESSYASVNLVDVNASQPIDIKIRPIGENISYLYPYDTLYPSDTLYMPSRILRFTNTTTNEVFDWELPTDLWYYDSNAYDELELSYGDGTNSTVTVTRKCKINADNTVSVLTTPTSETYDYPSDLVLTDGDYTVTLLGHSSAYLYVQLMAKNIYTTQFYTKAETNTLIDQTAQQITLEADEKFTRLDGKVDANTANITVNANAISSEVSRATGQENSLSSRIKQTATSIDLTATDNGTSAGLTIKLKNEDGTTLETDQANITMRGLVKFTDLSTSGSTTINGSNITTGVINANLITSGTLSANRISGGTINGNNVSVTNLNASNITGGTLNADRIATSSINASKLNISTLSAISSNLGTITGGSININNYFSVNSSGGTQLSTSGGGFLTTRTTTHPYVSALNVAQGAGGIVFGTGGNQSSFGSAKVSLELVSGVLRTRNYDVWSGGYYTCRTGKMSVIGQSGSGQYEYYVAIVNGLVVYVGTNISGYSELPWLV